MANRRINIGVLALQGAFQEHRIVLQRLGVSVCEVRLPEQLKGCDGLVLPGGETTAQRRLARAYGLWEPLREMGERGVPILGTCAGLILMATRVDSQEGLSLALMDIDVMRNAYGRQIHSFEAYVPLRSLESERGARPLIKAIFIRAPRIVRVGPEVATVARYDGEPVAVQQGNLLATSFHPELTSDDRLHRYFLRLVEASLRTDRTGAMLGS